MDFSARHPALTEEANDELEALFSIYDGDISYVEGEEASVVMNFRPRTADNALNSFVSADVLFFLASMYPTTVPSVKIARTSGFGDDGRGLDKCISAFISSVTLGEPVLMNMFEAIFDYMDGANEGECLICNESLGACSADGQSHALRANCYHCFHIDCLCRWGAVCHLATLSAKSGSVAQTQLDSNLKSLEGDIRAQMDAKLGLEQEIARLEEEIAAFSHLISTAAAASASDGKSVEVTDKSAKSKKKAGSKGSNKPPIDSAALPTPPSYSKNAMKGKNGKGTTAVEPAAVAPSVKDTVELDESAVRQLKIQLDQFNTSLLTARKKMDKINERIAADTQSLQLKRRVTYADKEIQEGYPHSEGVKCPFCTIVISESTHPHVATALRSGFDAALSHHLEKQQADGESHEGPVADVVSSGVHQSADSSRKGEGWKDRATTSVVPGGVGPSVLSLPPQLVELVRNIQNAQAELKSRLHCISSAS